MFQCEEGRDVSLSGAAQPEESGEREHPFPWLPPSVTKAGIGTVANGLTFL